MIRSMSAVLPQSNRSSLDHLQVGFKMLHSRLLYGSAARTGVGAARIVGLLLLSVLGGSAVAQQGSQSYGGYGTQPAYGDAPPPVRDYQGAASGTRRSANDAYRPPSQSTGPGYESQDYGRSDSTQTYGSATPSDAYGSNRGGYTGGYASNQGAGPNNQGPYSQGGSQGGFGQPYSPPPDATDRDYGRGSADPNYGPGPRRYDDRPSDGTYSSSEIADAGRGFFGSVSKGLASVIEHAFKRQGRPNGYILGEEAGGAFVAGLRYGEGTLYTRDAGTHKVYWQGPSVGYDFGGEGSKVMVLVYNLRDPRDIYERFGGVDGSAYLVGGVGITFLNRDHVTLAPIRSGVGLRLGANVGYLKYTPRPTWNPF
jgi:hypothetical protein